MEWYRDFPHIGYDIEGEKIYKPAVGDALDEFLKKMDDPQYGKTIYDKVNMRNIVLTDQEVDMITRIEMGTYAHASFQEHEPFENTFSKDVLIHPLSNVSEPKRRFVPSKYEHAKIIKLARAIRNGLIVPHAPKKEKKRWYSMWNEGDIPKAYSLLNMPAPKKKFPGHEESYNPPKEYLPTKEEKEKWESSEDKTENYLPQSYSRFRYIPRYEYYVSEQFERCLDLYLCPRTRKMRIDINPDDLIPKLPSLKDLKPFPTQCINTFRGHTKSIRTIDIETSGQFVFSGSDDCTLKIWEVLTGRCVKTYNFSSPVSKVKCTPLTTISLIAVAVDSNLIIINPKILSNEISTKTDEIFTNADDPQDELKAKHKLEWLTPNDEQYSMGYRRIVSHSTVIENVEWHHKGEYCATVVKNTIPVFVHQIIKKKSQSPFSKSPGIIQSIAFHPSMPFLIVATQRYIRIYNLIKKELVKKLVATVKWISSMDIHPGGDNIIVGSYDKKICWFDLDMSLKPYKVIGNQSDAIRSIKFHRRYPLFASCGNDGYVHVFHGRVFSDLLQNPLIVPLKKLTGHDRNQSLNVTDVVFHPKQPWVLSSGSDCTIRVYT